MERMQSIRKLTRRLILLLLMFPSLALAQIDIPVQTLGNYFQAGHDLAWGSSGQGGFNNNYILPGLGGTTVNLCVFVQNLNPTSAHVYNFQAYVTSNPTTTAFLKNATAWTPLQVTSPILSNGQQWSAASTDVRGPTPFLVLGATGAKIALDFNGATTQAGSPDTATIYGMYTYGTSCSAYLSGGTVFAYYNSAITANGQVSLFGRSAGSLFYGDPSTLSGCTFNAVAVNSAGTTPTLNFYIQDVDNSNSIVNDRISFLQATTGTSSQQASLSTDGSVAPAAVKNKTLAAGSEVSGKLSDEIRLAWTIGGTASPSYSLNVVGHCE